MPELYKLERLLGYQFKNQDLLYLALKHKSIQSDSNLNNQRTTNERLEFLGDRVLGLSIATILYEEFPLESEGQLAIRQAALVSNQSLTAIAQSVSLDKYIVMGGGQNASAMKFSNIAANAFESILGSIYLDSNFFETKKLVGTLWNSLIHEMSTVPKDSKNTLQELAAKRKYKAPFYKILHTSGTAHNPTFTVKVCIPNIGDANGQGSTKKSAEQVAASELLKCL